MKLLFGFILILFVFAISCQDKGAEPLNSTPSLDSLLLKYPDSVNLLVKHGELALTNFKYDIAIADAAKAFRLDSSRLDTRMLYADAICNNPAIQNADITKAQFHYQKLIKKEPKNIRALVGMAMTYTLRQDFDNSFKYINRALKINPRYRNAYVLKGSNYRMLGNTKLAISSYETAVQQDPNFYGGYLMIGALYQYEKDPICIQYYTTATQLQPNNPDCLYALAYAKEIFGQENDAKMIYRKMIRIDSTYYEAYFQLGYIKQFTDLDLDSALYFYNAALDIEPRHIESNHNIGLIYEDKKDNSRALLSYAKVLKYNPEFELTLERVAVLKKRR
jgi:tetratricopeptide (TPR) repeat protein